MKKLLLFCSSFLIISCTQKSNTKDDSLKQWILQHEHELVSASDTIIRDYRKEHAGTHWVSAEIAVTNSMSGTLGALAEKASDTTNCIVVGLMIFNNPAVKRRIFLEATDANCLWKLDKIELGTDSTQGFVFGKTNSSLQ